MGAYNHFFACLAAQFSEKEEQALNHCEVALKALSQRMCALMNDLGAEQKQNASESETATQAILDASSQCVKGLSGDAKESEDGGAVGAAERGGRSEGEIGRSAGSHSV